jgi:hypothetical protein
MAPNTSDQIPTFAVGDVETPQFNFTEQLRSGELLASVTDITEESSTDLTISNKAVSTAELTILGQTVIIGQALQCKVLGQLLATGSYSLLAVVVTDSSPARTMKRRFKFKVSNE